MNQKIKQLTQYVFKNETLLTQAFTHTSYANEKKSECLSDNERLEFLGDAILELVVSEYLFHNFSQWTEGQLTRFRAQLVCEQTLSTIAKECEFDQLVLLGKGEQLAGGRERPSLLCDLFESFVGALYLDGGLSVAKSFILKCIVPKIEENQKLFIDYKTLLQEHFQQNGAVNIVYTIIHEEGSAHDKFFTATVALNGEVIGQGTGKSKKIAQQQAAKFAYERLGE